MAQLLSSNVGLDVAPLSTANASYSDLESPLSPYGPWFGRLPVELRILVWIDVLVSCRDIANASVFMRPQEPLIVANFPPNEGIDAALLRTCRAIYEEAFPILYGNNRFVFHYMSQITEFAFGKLYFPFGQHLLDSPLGHALKHDGRLSMLRSMTLRLIPDTQAMLNILISQVREADWSVWAEFLQPSDQHPLTFPVLEDLCLDFSEWSLENSNECKLRVEPFLRKLRPSGGLRRLLIFGIKHEQNLNDLKHGFVKEGGRFQAVDRFRSHEPDYQKILADEIVSYSNLHTVSKGVRDILQRDGVPALIL